MKSKHQRLKNRADKLWAKYIKLRVGNKCEVCGRVEYLNSHHIFSRSNLSVRWDLENGVCLCPRCHIIMAHQNPVEFVKWLEQKLGKKRIEQLRIKARQIKKWTSKDLEKLIEYLKIKQNC